MVKYFKDPPNILNRIWKCIIEPTDGLVISTWLCQPIETLYNYRRNRNRRNISEINYRSMEYLYYGRRHENTDVKLGIKIINNKNIHIYYPVTDDMTDLFYIPFWSESDNVVFSLFDHQDGRIHRRINTI